MNNSKKKKKRLIRIKISASGCCALSVVLSLRTRVKLYYATRTVAFLHAAHSSGRVLFAFHLAVRAVLTRTLLLTPATLRISLPERKKKTPAEISGFHFTDSSAVVEPACCGNIVNIDFVSRRNGRIASLEIKSNCLCFCAVEGKSAETHVRVDDYVQK